MPGRRPKPSALKKAAGNPGKRKLNAKEPQPGRGIPDCPPHLDEVAKEEWKRITPHLYRLGILSRIDRTALACYCQSFARWVDAEKNLKKYGSVIKTPKGYPVQNPYLGIANTAVATMRSFLTEFGMTPSSRSRIQVNTELPGASESQPAGIDEWAEFGAPNEVKRVQ